MVLRWFRQAQRVFSKGVTLLGAGKFGCAPTGL